MSRDQFDRWMSELSNWGRWGADDQLGALNLITAEKRIAAAGLVRSGRAVSLARTIEIDAQATAGTARADRPPELRGSVRSVFEIDVERGFFWERSEIEYHGVSVSHLDALCHVAHRGKLYGGRSFEDVASRQKGCEQLGVANLKDGLVTRGLLIDLPGSAVGPAELKAWEEETGIAISPGDALLLRTGRDAGQAGGYAPSLFPFLKERDVALLGADMPQEGGCVEGVAIPVHLMAIVALGVHLFDNLDLEAAARTAAELQRWEFMFVASPNPVPNGAGAAINPLAIF